MLNFCNYWIIILYFVLANNKPFLLRFTPKLAGSLGHHSSLNRVDRKIAVILDFGNITDNLQNFELVLNFEAYLQCILPFRLLALLPWLCCCPKLLIKMSLRSSCQAITCHPSTTLGENSLNYPFDAKRQARKL